MPESLSKSYNVLPRKKKACVSAIVLNNFTHDSRVLKENESLAAAGYHVNIIALHDKGFAQKECVSGLPVFRIKLVSRHWGKFKPIQIIKYVEFLLRVYPKCRHADILHCNDLETLPVGVIIKCFFNKKIKIVYDSHEYQIERKNFGKIEKKLVKILERILIRYADHVITVSDSIAKEYASLYSIPKPSLVLNCPKYYKIVNADINIRNMIAVQDEATVFMYHGNFSKGRGIETLLQAFATINDVTKIIIFMGYGHLEKEIIEYANHHQNIFHHPAVAPQDVLAYSAHVNMGLLFYEDISLNHRYCLPNKLFDYFMAGLPVLTSSELIEVKRVVSQYGAGLSVPNTPADIMSAVCNMDNIKIAQYQKNLGKITANYNWKNQETVLLNIYDKLSRD